MCVQSLGILVICKKLQGIMTRNYDKELCNGKLNPDFLSKVYFMKIKFVPIKEIISYLPKLNLHTNK